MNPPEWPGQPGYPPQGPGFGPPAPGFPAPPPPKSGGGTVALLIIGGFVVLIVIGIVGFVVFTNDDDDDNRRTISAPSSYSTPTETYAPSTETPIDTSTPTATPPPSGKSVARIFTPTFKTARGNTFTRGGTRTGSCISRADKELLTALRSNPCTASMESAVYANPGRDIITVVSVLTFASSSDASAVSNSTNTGAAPTLLVPSKASGLPRLTTAPQSWTRSWTQDEHVIYAQSYRARGGNVGTRTGTVYTTAGELGVEVTNVLRFS
ncbi:hypothetical protein [Spirillospora sp. CA-294931]|uniref:hypothetical protein n=1 Tax=Spirillospora sp. CA-294931 TaxID=3240042 RepID=UPI003D919451